MLKQAEKLIGIELTDAQEAMALQNVSTNLDRYETLRKIDVPPDTEPATLFHPALPGRKFNLKPAKFKLSAVETPRFSSLDELAFAPLTQLAELVRTRKISTVELTKMYLARLKKYGPKLNCVVTLTEELALSQASDRRTGNQGGQVSWTVARHCLGRKGLVCDQRNSHYLGSGTLSRSGDRLRCNRRGASA